MASATTGGGGSATAPLQVAAVMALVLSLLPCQGSHLHSMHDSIKSCSTPAGSQVVGLDSGVPWCGFQACPCISADIY